MKSLKNDGMPSERDEIKNSSRLKLVIVRLNKLFQFFVKLVSVTVDLLTALELSENPGWIVAFLLITLITNEKFIDKITSIWKEINEWVKKKP